MTQYTDLREQNGVFLSFLRPCGRIGRWPFWWRQLLLATLLYPCCNVSSFSGVKMFGSDIMQVVSLIPPLLAQCFAPTCLSSVWSSVEGTVYACYWVEFHHAPMGLVLWPGIPALLCYIVALLAAWSSLALMLRRLRDTRAGLRALPLCLPLIWVAPFLIYERVSDKLMNEGFAMAAFCLPLIASLILSLLPSRKGD